MAHDGTPPHHPTFNVRMTQDDIKTLASLVFPGRRLIKSEQLPSGKSFNNRIYFLDVSTDPESTSKTEQYVLKLAGHFFGPTKIENEVGCLQVLAKYCPGVPAPTAIAWSSDGSAITTVDGRSLQWPKSQAEDSDNGNTIAGRKWSWVLQNRLPGRLLDFKDLDGPSGRKIMKSLANIIAEWRTKIPQVRHFGNLRYREPSDTSQSTTIFTNLGQSSREFAIGGLILATLYSKSALQSAADFYSYYAQDNLRDLRQRPVLKPLARKIEDTVRIFVDEDLPNLPVFRNHKGTSKFTHFDFAPRNILVSNDDPSLIIGILDCEFAGFAPWEEEFINMQVRQHDDWSKQHYQILIEELVNLGLTVPPKVEESSTSSSSQHFAQVCILAKLIENIRPWYIQEGSHSQAELEEEFAKASSVVLESIEQLRQTL